MNTSFTLQSSMSPKTIISGKSRKKGPTLLSLKKNIRKSLAYENNSRTSLGIRQSPEIISDSYTDSTYSTSNTIEEKLHKEDSIIVISDTDLSEESNSHNDKQDLCVIKNSFKFDKVLKWLDNVNVTENGSDNSSISNNHKEDDICNSVIFIDSVKHLNTSAVVVNDTFEEVLYSENEPLKKSDTNKFLEENECMNVNMSVVLVNDTFDESMLNKSLESRLMLMNLNENMVRKSINSKFSDDHQSTKLMCQENLITHNFGTNDKNNVSKNIELSAHDNKISTKIKESGNEKNVALDEDDLSLLSQIYGNNWNITKSWTEKKIRSKKLQETETKKKKIPMTNVKKKSEGVPKSWSNLKSVWVQTIQNICDPDTSSVDSENEHDVVKKKLSFTDSDDQDDKEINILNNRNEIDDKIDIKRTAKKPNVKYRHNSDKENYSSDSCSDYDLKVIKTLPKKRIQTKIRSKKTSAEAEKITLRNVNNMQPKTATTRKQYSFLASLSGTVKIDECHLEARKYRQNFPLLKEELGKKLFRLYNEKIFDNQLKMDTPLEWSANMRKTAGFCYNRRKMQNNKVLERTCRIVLATKVIDSADRLRDTLIHEMCHGAAWTISEVKDGHGPIWRNWALKAMLIFPELPRIERCHDYEINTKYTYKCVGCGYSIGRHSKSLDIGRKRCGYCYGQFEVFLNKVNKTGTKTMTPLTTKKRELSGFPLFVKENYGIVKKPQLNHKDVMRILSEQFSALKVKNDADDAKS